MSKEFTAVITQEEKWYVARCVELGVVSQGKTSEEAQANLKEAVELYLESFGEENLTANQYCRRPHEKISVQCPD